MRNSLNSPGSKHRKPARGSWDSGGKVYGRNDRGKELEFITSTGVSHKPHPRRLPQRVRYVTNYHCVEKHGMFITSMQW